MKLSAVALAALLLLFPSSVGNVLALVDDEPNFETILTSLGPALAELDSDELAAKLFERHLRQALGLVLPPPDVTRTHSHRTPPLAQVTAPPQDFLDSGRRLTAELTAWRLARSLKDAAGTGEIRRIQSIFNDSRKQQSWLTAEDQRRMLARAWRMAETTLLFADERVDEALVSDTDYVAHLDRIVPRLIGPNDSWMTIVEREGAAGVHHRLLAYWEQLSPSASTVTDAEKQAVAARYFYTRLKPVFLAQTYALAATAEVEAQQHVRDLWLTLKSWPDRVREARAAARLCGTWNWTIHNHQNHLDHKSVMVFPPANGRTAGGGPAKLLVLGDVVYLRWEFPGGVQEDSLLFTGDGQRLEGSFVNSSGAWGSITGKRVAACPR